MFFSHQVLAIQRRLRPRGAHQGQFPTQAICADRNAQFGCAAQNSIGHFDIGQQCFCLGNLLDRLLFRFCPIRHESRTIALERITAAQHFDAAVEILRRPHFD